jgi:hypothetical protein
MLGASLIVEDAVVGLGLHESCSQGIYVVFYTEELIHFIIGNNKQNHTNVSQFTTRMSVQR